MRIWGKRVMVGFKRIKYQVVQYLVQRFLLPCSNPDLGFLLALKNFHLPSNKARASSPGFPQKGGFCILQNTAPIQGLKTAFVGRSYKFPLMLDPSIATSGLSATLPGQEHEFSYFASSHQVRHQFHLSFSKSLFSNKNLKLLHVFSSKDLGENWRPGGNWGKLKNFCYSHNSQHDVYPRRKPSPPPNS